MSPTPEPQGEEMFKFHGYSGPCPKPPLPRPPTLAEAAQRLLNLIDELPEEPGGQQDRVFAAYEFDDLRAALAAQPKAPSPTPGEAEEAFARIDEGHVDEQLCCLSCGCDDGHKPTCDMLKVKTVLAAREEQVRELVEAVKRYLAFIPNGGTTVTEFDSPATRALDTMKAALAALNTGENDER